MAFSYGFFNSKNLDRTYTAENFCDYLGSLICNGIQDNYGDCFKPTISKLKLTVGSGKAWINGHYFISDTAYTFDLSQYVDESLPRYLAIGICCNTGENYRNIGFETLVGTPATSPSVPKFSNTDTKTYLTLCTVHIEAGTTTLKASDYRNNTTYCGYVRCILGKCKVTEMLEQLEEITAQITDYNTTVTNLTNQIAELTTKMDEVSGDVISIGNCGDSATYVLYSDGKLIIKGTGAMYDYTSTADSSGEKSPFYDNDAIKKVVVSEGITSVGEFAFLHCDNLTSATLPTTLTAIKRNAFQPNIDGLVVHKVLNGLTVITIPNKVTSIGQSAFAGTAITEVTIPSTVTTIGESVFSGCQALETVRMSGKMISVKMFVNCIKLKNLTITKSCTQIYSHCFNYCESLESITYEGTLADWQAITKQTNWDGHSVDTSETPLTKIQCLDGYMEYNSTSKTWKEVKAS